MPRADLHNHTTASDGLRSPSDVVFRARDLGLSAVGITDHDTLDGLEEAIEAGRAAGIEVVWGVELSTESAGEELHILAYYPDLADRGFRELLDTLRRARAERARAMVERLRGLGLDVTMEQVREMAGDAPLARPHFARLLIARGAATTMRDAFDRFLAPGRPAYVPRFKLSPQDAVREITRAGGVPVLAHPELTRSARWIGPLAAVGLAGVEAWHISHATRTARWYEGLAALLGLLPTGGSDSHGPIDGRPDPLGMSTVDDAIVERLRSLRRRH